MPHDTRAPEISSHSSGIPASQTRDFTLSEAIMAGETANRRGPQPNAREQFIIQRVAEGCKNRELADSMGTTEPVVKKYLRLIYDKLGLWHPGERALWYEARQNEQVY